MIQPSRLAYLLAHPALILALMLILGVSGYAYFTEIDEGAWVGCVAAALGLGACCRADEQVKQFRRWHAVAASAAADSGIALPVRRRGSANGEVFAVIMIGGFLYLIAENLPQYHEPAFLLAGLAALLFLSFRFVRWFARVVFRRRPRAIKAIEAKTVTIAVARPLMPTLPLAQLYRQLPAYCYELRGMKSDEGA